MTQIAYHKFHEERETQVTIVPAPWDEPKPEPRPVPRLIERPRATVTTLRPRIPAAPNPDTFCSHDEDVLALAMQHLDGVAEYRFPRTIQPKQASDYKPGSLASRVREVLRQDGPSTAQHVADRLGVRRSSAMNCLSDQRGNGRAVCDPKTKAWSLT